MITKEKLRRFRQERTHRHISLHKTAGRQHMYEDKLWSPRPKRIQRPQAFGLETRHSTDRQHKLNKARHVRATKIEKSPRKRTRKMSLAKSWSDPVIIATSGEETDTADEFQLDALSPQYPPEHEKGQQPLKYVPKSPVYPPPEDCSDKDEFYSIPDLETPREEMSPMQDKIQHTDGETQMTVPADANADMDHFNDENRKDTLKRQFSTELDAAVWNKDESQPELQGMEKVAKSVKPAYEDFWQESDRDTLARLNEAAKKLKDR